MLQNLRVAFRALMRQRAFTGAAVLTLGLGIGATTAIFSVVYGITVGLLTIVVVASAIPAREASGVAPAEALRGEQKLPSQTPGSTACLTRP